MDQIANYMLTIPIVKNMIITIFYYSHKLTFVLCFSSTLVSLGFFSTKFHMSISSKNWYM
jgi:ABC-type bacteriocin/lantibiotic exporter with double-glycine peptidase domain